MIELMIILTMVDNLANKASVLLFNDFSRQCTRSTKLINWFTNNANVMKYINKMNGALENQLSQRRFISSLICYSLS